MAKRPPLSTGKENSKWFDFLLDGDDFEEHTRWFAPATTAADTQKCIKLFEDWKREQNSLFPMDKVPEGVLFASKGACVSGCANSALKSERKTARTTLPRQLSITWWAFRDIYACRNSRTLTSWAILSFFHLGIFLIACIKSYTLRA